MRIEILKGLTITNGNKLYRETNINAGTRALFDFRTSWGGAAKTLTNTDVVNDLAYTTNTATVQSGGSQLTFVGNGMYFPSTTATQMARFSLSNNAVPKFTDTNWLAHFWIAPEKYSQSGNVNNQLFMFGIDNGFTAATTMLGCMVNTASDGLTPTYFNFAVRGVLFQVINNTALNTTLTASPTAEPTLLSIQCNVVGSNTVFNLYLNGVLINTQTKANQAASFTATRNYLNAAGVYTSHNAGKYYRYKLDDLTQISKDVTTLIAEEYTSLKDVFS